MNNKIEFNHCTSRDKGYNEGYDNDIKEEEFNETEMSVPVKETPLKATLTKIILKMMIDVKWGNCPSRYEDVEEVRLCLAKCTIGIFI